MVAVTLQYATSRCPFEGVLSATQLAGRVTDPPSSATDTNVRIRVSPTDGTALSVGLIGELVDVIIVPGETLNAVAVDDGEGLGDGPTALSVSLARIPNKVYPFGGVGGGGAPVKTQSFVLA